MNKRLLFLLVVIGVMLLLFYFKVLPMLKVVTGYTAKCHCSNHFMTDRPKIDVDTVDLDFLPVQASANIDTEQRTVTASLFGLGYQKAQFKEDLGCVLIQDDDDYKVTYKKTSRERPELPYPYGDVVNPEDTVSGVDYKALRKAVDSAFDPAGRYHKQKTSAVVVIHKDTMLMERYGQGFDKNTPIIGWSMTKSIMNALVGMLIKEGKLSLDDDSLFPDWAADERKEITLRHLLQMTSGLDWQEVYDAYSDATEMLYITEDVVANSIDNTLAHAPGTYWYYSSGTSNIISGLIRRQFSSLEEYYDYLHQRLYGRIGMQSALIETDESGNFIGSSFGYATARDWGRFGTLYLNEGYWLDDQVLPEGWVDFTRSPAPNSKGEYGGHFWLNVDQQYFPDLPGDMYSANGFQGQKTIIIPSKELVIVRLGYNSDFDFNQFISDIIAALL